MTAIESIGIINGFRSNALQPKGIFDRLATEIKNPERLNSGGDSVAESDRLGRGNSSLSDTPNSYKDYGVSMTTSGYFIIPRSVSSDKRYKSARLKYKHVLHVLLENVAFTPTTYAIGTKLIPINVGQFCASERHLMKLCNEDVKFKDELVDKNIIHRAVQFWATCGILNHEVNQGKLIITITISEFYGKNKNTCEPTSEPLVNLNRTTNEKRKKEKNIKETIEGGGDFDSSLFNLEKSEKEEAPSIFQSKEKQEFSPEEKKHYDFLWAHITKSRMNDGFTPNKKKGIKESDLQGWLKKYKATEIMQALQSTLKSIPTQTWAGYVNKLLSGKIIQKENQSELGRIHVQKIVDENKMDHIEMLKDYFKDHSSNGIETYYSRPIPTLDVILENSLLRAASQKDEEIRKKAYENR